MAAPLAAGCTPGGGPAGGGGPCGSGGCHDIAQSAAVTNVPLQVARNGLSPDAYGSEGHLTEHALSELTLAELALETA